MNWNGKRVLVTGAGGFIGSHLVERLVELGADVTAFVRYNSRNGRGFLPESVGAYYGDIQDADAFNHMVLSHDVVFHLAAVISVPYSFDRPWETFAVNAVGTLNVLQACKNVYDQPMPRLIITSTSEVYGSAAYQPMDEKHPKRAQSPYAASKIAADALAIAYHRTYNLPVTVLRPFNTFGPRQSDRAFIPAMISQVLTQDEVKVGNLSPERDFTFVSDTVEGFIKAAECDEAIGQEINLGTGLAFSMCSVVDLIQELTERQVSIIPDPERMRSTGSEVTLLRSNNTKAKTLLGWEPRVSLRDGLALTIEWIREHKGLFAPERYRV